MPRTSPAKIQLDNLKQDIAAAGDETAALKAFKAFTEHIFVNHKLYEPDVWRKNTWSGWVKTARKTIKNKFPDIKLPKVWFNTKEIIEIETDNEIEQSVKDTHLPQALKDACKAQNSELHRHIWGSDEPQAEPTPEAPTEAVEDAEPQSQEPRLRSEGIVITPEVDAAIARSGMDEDAFILKALDAYADSIQGKSAELSQLSNDDLKGSKKAGHGEALCERAVKAVIAHNEATKDTAARYQITFPVIKTLTGCSTAIVERVLGNPTKGVQGTMKDEIAEHHDSLDMVSKVYNRGKPPVTDWVTL